MDNITKIALARKYRPQSLSELRGQEILVKILSNAIINNRLHHAYILSGIHGIGKTTTARIIAKTVNCSNIQILSESNIAVPCNSCNNCMNYNKNLDILEIDAASNTGVENVRDLISNAQYKPLAGKYKIFIIDEVHMLSKSAFNALLKLLEEPPLHMIFIFATTELNKIPVTIISRCQRFDLRPFSNHDLVKLLQVISAQEKIIIEEDALHIIAMSAGNSARDAISLLDQARGLSENISAKLVKDMIGLVDLVEAIMMVRYIIASDTKSSIELLNGFVECGKSIEKLFEQMLDVICYLTKIKTIENYKDLSYSEYQNQIEEIVQNIALPSLTILWQILFNSMMEFKTSHSLLHAAEIALIKSIYAATMPSIDQIIKNIPTVTAENPGGP